MGIVSNMQDVSIWTVIDFFEVKEIPGIMLESFGVIDLVFYGFAIYEGYRFSFRSITEQDIINIKKGLNV